LLLLLFRIWTHLKRCKPPTAPIWNTQFIYPQNHTCSPWTASQPHQRSDDAAKQKTRNTRSACYNMAETWKHNERIIIFIIIKQYDTDIIYTVCDVTVQSFNRTSCSPTDSTSIISNVVVFRPYPRRHRFVHRCSTISHSWAAQKWDAL